MNDGNVALIEASGGWREIADAASSGAVPQSVGVVVPSVMQETFVEMYARAVLDDESGWNAEGHPDLIYAGTPDAPPDVDACRALQAALGLCPVSARYRLAVVRKAEKLSAPASNKLLKITEEPPERGRLLFLFEEETVIPTLRSRMWLLRVDMPEELVKPRPMPATPKEWAAWMDVSRKPTPEILYLEMQGWARDFAQRGDYTKASELDSLTRVLERGRFSAPLIEDLVFALFREEVPNEQIFGNLW